MFQLDLQRRGGLSDANNLGHLAPALDGFGPVGAHAHRAGVPDSVVGSEVLCAETVVPKTELLAEVLRELATSA